MASDDKGVPLSQCARREITVEPDVHFVQHVNVSGKLSRSQTRQNDLLFDELFLNGRAESPSDNLLMGRTRPVRTHLAKGGNVTSTITPLILNKSSVASPLSHVVKRHIPPAFSTLKGRAGTSYVYTG